MPRRSEPAPGSVIAIAPTSSPRTSAGSHASPLLVVAVLEHVVRRDLVHALAEAREARVQQLLVDHALEAEVAARARRARPARRCRAGRPPRRSRQSSASTYPRACQRSSLRQDLALDPRPRGLAEQLVLVARPGRAGTRGWVAVMRGSSHRGAETAKWHSRRVPLGRPVESARHADSQPASGRATCRTSPLTDFVLGGAAARGERPAIVDAVSGAVLTYARAGRATSTAARPGSRRAGSQPGERVGIYAPNVPEYAVAFHGVARAGGTNTTVNGLYTAERGRVPAAHAPAPASS